MTNKPWLRKKQAVEFVEVMGVKVFLKALTYGKSRQATSLAMKIDYNTQEIDMDANLLALLRAIYQISSWELVDDKDKPLPITLKTFDDILDEEFVNELIQKISGTSTDATDAVEKKL